MVWVASVVTVESGNAGTLTVTGSLRLRLHLNFKACEFLLVALHRVSKLSESIPALKHSRRK